eukprot:GHVL01006754.1.p1 GENE.GHVL01006754.1~~GHVL01006754.1.p1  ORF type:complete len:870 (+),score=176.16 GHVL01006754.1:33-2642(+)
MCDTAQYAKIDSENSELLRTDISSENRTLLFEWPCPPNDLPFNRTDSFGSEWPSDIAKTLALLTRSHMSRSFSDSRGPLILSPCPANAYPATATASATAAILSGKHCHTLSCLALSNSGLNEECDVDCNCEVDKFGGVGFWNGHMAGTVKQIAHIEDLTMEVGFTKKQSELNDILKRLEGAKECGFSECQRIGSPGWMRYVTLESALLYILTHGTHPMGLVPTEMLINNKEIINFDINEANNRRWGCEKISEVVERSSCAAQVDDLICEWCLPRFLHYKQLVLLYTFSTKYEYWSGNLYNFIYGNDMYFGGISPSFPIVPFYVLTLLPSLVLTRSYINDIECNIVEDYNEYIDKWSTLFTEKISDFTDDFTFANFGTFVHRVQVFRCLDRQCSGLFSGITQQPTPQPVKSSLTLEELPRENENETPIINPTHRESPSVWRSLLSAVSGVFANEKKIEKEGSSNSMFLSPKSSVEVETASIPKTEGVAALELMYRRCLSAPTKSTFDRSFLEFGCAVGGAAACLVEWGWKGVGVTLPESKGGQPMLMSEKMKNNLTLIYDDILEMATQNKHFDGQYDLLLCSICAIPTKYTIPKGAEFECATQAAQLLIGLPHLRPGGTLVMELMGSLPKLRSLATIWHLLRLFGPQRVRLHGANDRASRSRGRIFVVCREFSGVETAAAADFLHMLRQLFYCNITHLEHLPLPKHVTVKNLCALMEVLRNDAAILWSKQIEYIKELYPDQLASNQIDEETDTRFYSKYASPKYSHMTPTYSPAYTHKSPILPTYSATPLNTHRIPISGECIYEYNRDSNSTTNQTSVYHKYEVNPSNDTFDKETSDTINTETAVDQIQDESDDGWKVVSKKPNNRKSKH